MIYKTIFTGLVVGVLAIASPALGVPTTSGQLTTPGTSRTLVLPPQADNSPFISLGTSIDPISGKVVEGYAIFHHREGHEKGGAPGGGGDVSSCYAFLAKDAKWKTLEPWIVNPTNLEGLSDAFVLNNLSANIAKWETAGEADILGDGTSTSSILVADTASPDGVNEVYFADIADPGVIAVTITWGVFGGPPSGRELVEWDQVYDDVSFDWSLTGETGRMDFENIAQHELGHALGLSHPDDSCLDETMYRFAGLGEIKKQDLSAGDIAGADKLY